MMRGGVDKNVNGSYLRGALVAMVDTNLGVYYMDF